ncbi:fibrocystin-L-like [Watersipora subatra]|uniref:fibrocystin-L-like n=1 Tax=Watersipora subatra TaxID=2589382 RepID=UPI00355BD9C4
MTWTRLSSTATAGSTQIELEWGQADWPVGGTIAIATTGDRHSQIETELRNITAISNDGKKITLSEPLEYEHLGVTEELGGGHTLEMRAEVALLSRNVRVVGSRDIQWSDEIEACPDGFDTGEFATQTCFQDRFGDEIGSDQFGAQIMFHAPIRDTKLARGKLSYIEVNYAGQAFRLGRYPVHFHLNGDMSGSYVKGLSIHEAFNRAINIHGTHNILVEHTVIYNIMGGAFFLEDGIETGNRYRYNLALFVRASSSLLNDDITPAAFWATNPDNHYEHNAVAGGTHFGFWYRLLEHPEGMSATTSVCPRRVPLGTSYNNSVHSNGWFGLWTFQDYYPMVGGGCDSTDPEPAVFEKFIVWNCEKGLEFVNGGSLQFVDCLLANNKLTALEGKKNMLLGVEAPYTDRGPMIRDSVIAAYAPNYPHSSGGKRIGIVLPWSAGFSVKNVKFINFDESNAAVFGMTDIQGTCSELCGGWNYHMEKISFINGDQQRSNFRWLHDGVFVDLDGSYSGAAGNKVLPWMDTMDPSKCAKDYRFSIGAVEGAVCDRTTKFARLSFNNPGLSSMLFKNVLFTNDFGTHIAPFANKRMTHETGWTSVVESGQEYKMVWENMEHIVNISYSAIFEDLEDFSVIITHNVITKPDRVRVQEELRDIADASSNKLNTDSSYHGDFYFNDNDKELSYMVSYKRRASRKRRSSNAEYLFENVNFESQKCYYPDCQSQPDQNTLPPSTSYPEFSIRPNTTIRPNNVLPGEDEDAN